jgi:hypothetical protein
MNNKRRSKYHDIDMEVDVNSKNQINNTNILIYAKNKYFPTAHKN